MIKTTFQLVTGVMYENEGLFFSWKINIEKFISNSFLIQSKPENLCVIFF